ncbi:MAG: LOG family protein [Candidatus Bathyarchaeota archaeon]|nr:LOG family protein [Candidatus Bathyarchaeota archaeon]
MYESIYTLAKSISEAGMDVVTGGGAGLMDAASEGRHAGREGRKTHSIGLRIKLSFEEREAANLDIKKEFRCFSSRPDDFVRVSNAVAVAPGGAGTLLEHIYT